MLKGITRKLYLIAMVLFVLSIANTGGFVRYMLLSRGDAELINELGQIRGQIQRVTKLYLAEDAEQKRIDTIAEIDSKLERFQELEQRRWNVVDEEVGSQLDDIKEKWTELRALLSERSSRDERVIAVSETAWRIANTSVLYLQKRAERERSYLYFSLATLLLLVLGVLGMIIYVRRLINRRIEYHAMYDELTGVLNRTTLGERLKSFMGIAERYGRPFSLLMLDIDNFKRINDEFGHHTGDNVLQALALRITMYLRSVDIVYRYGGEEFIVVLPETRLEEALKVAEKLRREVEERSLVEEIGCTVSCGVAVWREDDRNDTLLERVDKAMYRAKEGGRNRVAAPPDSSQESSQDFSNFSQESPHA